MPLQATSGAASYDAFGGGVPVVPAYIEDVFSTYLYTGTGAAQTITNGIDLSTKGGLVWIKDRTTTGVPHRLFDTVRGGTKSLRSNSTSAENTGDPAIIFNTTGFATSTDVNGEISASGDNYASWTFRKQPKFFDVVTYTGTGSNTTIAHSLGSVPGSIIVKRTDTTADWAVYHRSLANTQYLVLNTTAAAATGATWWNSTTPTSAVFSVGTDATVNASGGTYVAYLFAHNAGGFGLTGTDNVISCGSYTEGGVGTEQTINLGYEAQWLLIKPSSVTGSWYIYDVMRGFAQTVNNYLLTNSTNAEASTNSYLFKPAATGFIAPGDLFGSSANVIYIAIRRGPMKVPTDATKMFAPVFRNASSGLPQWNSGFVTDFSIVMDRDGSGNIDTVDRLRGTKRLLTYDTAAESNGSPNTLWDYMNGYGSSSGSLYDRQVAYMFRRAPGFFDEVCYTGDGTTPRAINHNLGITPELVIVKDRTFTGLPWMVWGAPLGTTNALALNETTAPPTYGGFQGGSMTSTTFNIAGINTNRNTDTFVAYLFATCAGVSKVGSYTGNGSTQTIDCGFTGGARFVLIKRTDSTGDWYVWDSARGIVAGNDPHLSLNTTAAEVTTDDSVDTDNTGFVVNQLSATNINVTSASYIFLSVA